MRQLGAFVFTRNITVWPSVIDETYVMSPGVVLYCLNAGSRKLTSYLRTLMVKNK